MQKQLIDSSIFIKQSEIRREEQKLRVNDLNKIIPSSCLDKEDIKLKENMTEWRWRILEINDKIFTEISMMEPNKQRIYFNKYKKWIEKKIDPAYDRYVKRTYYYYTN